MSHPNTDSDSRPGTRPGAGLRTLGAAAVAGAFTLACATEKTVTTGDASPGIRVKSGDEFFGLDYQVDPETGMMKNERSKEIPHDAFYSGEDAVKTNEHFARGTRYETTDYGAARSKFDTEETKTPSYEKTTSRFQGRGNRASSRRALDGTSPYNAEQYATSPYREGAEMMETGAYRPAADSQAGGTRPDGGTIRSPRSGEQGPMMREADAMTVDDVQAVLNKP